MRSRLSHGTTCTLQKMNSSKSFSKMQIGLKKYFEISSDKVIDPHKVVQALHEIRNTLLMTASENRNNLVVFLQDNKFLKDSLKFITDSCYRKKEILEELTWVLLLMFSYLNEGTMIQILDDTNLIIHLNNLLNYTDIEVFSNVVWTLANILSDNPTIKNLFSDLELFKRIESRMEALQINGPILNPSFYQSYLIYLDCHLCTIPFLETQGSLQKHLNRCIQFWMNSSEQLLSCFEQDLLSCIRHLTHFTTLETLQKHFNQHHFTIFLKMGFEKLEIHNYQFKAQILGIFTNLTSDLMPEILQIFSKNKIQKSLINCLVHPDHAVKTVILLGNILLEKTVFRSFFFNNNIEIFKNILHLFGSYVELRQGDQTAIDELLRTIQIFIVFGDKVGDHFIHFCLENKSKRILHIVGVLSNFSIKFEFY